MQALNWSLLTSITDDKVVYRVDCITFYVTASENVQWMRNGQMIPTETVTHELINETNLAYNSSLVIQDGVSGINNFTCFAILGNTELYQSITIKGCTFNLLSTYFFHYFHFS